MPATYYWVKRIPELNYRRGGNASNSSSVLAQLGMPSEFLGSLSHSIELDFIKGDFAAHCVSFEHCPVLTDFDFPTSVVMVNVSNGSRTILHHSKSLPELSLQHFSRIDVNNYAWVHLEVRSCDHYFLDLYTHLISILICPREEVVM